MPVTSKLELSSCPLPSTNKLYFPSRHLPSLPPAQTALPSTNHALSRHPGEHGPLAPGERGALSDRDMAGETYPCRHLSLSLELAFLLLPLLLASCSLTTVSQRGLGRRDSRRKKARVEGPCRISTRPFIGHGGSLAGRWKVVGST